MRVTVVLQTIALWFFTSIEIASALTCRSLLPRPPWVRPDLMPEILFHPEEPFRIVRVTCPADGSYANITWWKDSQLMAHGSEIAFRPLQSHHVGKYHCQAENSAGLSISAKLEVNRAFFEAETPVVLQLFLMEGQAASIACRAPKGYPKPTVFWNITGQNKESRMTVDAEGTLHLQDPRVSDSATAFKCFAEHLLKIYPLKTVHLTVHPRPQPCFEKTRLMYATSSIVLRNYSRFLIYCITSGQSMPLWKLPDGAKSAVGQYSKNYLQIDPSTLAMSDRTLKLQCENNGVQSEIPVVLSNAPIVSVISNMTKIEGERVVLQCLASGKPKPKIEWLFNGQPVDSRHVSRGEILFPSVAIENMGVYRCEAFNSYGRTYEEVILNVESANPHIVADTECFEALVGDRLSVPCEAKAFRNPKKIWVKNGHQIEEAFGDDYLIFNNIQPDDRGDYACQVCEDPASRGCVLYKFKIEVFTSKLLETPQKPIIISENGKLNISCIPRFEDDVIMWQINGSVVSVGRTLFLEKPSFGTYTCELRRNGALVSHWDGLVTVRKRPEKPKISKISCENGYALLKWTLIEGAAFYEIFHLENSRTWQMKDSVAHRTETRVKLSDCTRCKFRVSAINEAGAKTSEVEFCVLPLEPVEKPFRIRDWAIYRQHDSLHASWTLSEVSKQSCFRVCLYPKATCKEISKPELSFKLSEHLLQSFLYVDRCNNANIITVKDDYFPVKMFYNCNLTLSITDIQHSNENAINVTWKFSADSRCVLKGRLAVDDSRVFNVDLHDKQYQLRNFEHNKIYCLRLTALHGNLELAGSIPIDSCFQRGRGWELLNITPNFQLRNHQIIGSLPNNTLVYQASIGEKQEWQLSNVTSIHTSEMIKFVQKSDDYCRVSKVIYLRQHNEIDWLLWLCGVSTIISGLFITVAILLRKKSIKVELN